MSDHGSPQAQPSFGVAVGGSATWADVARTATRIERSPEVSTLWVFDERFERDPWVSLGLLAATTQRVRLGTSVTDAFIRHPALTAAAIATLDEASGGRAVLGLGAGVSGFRALGLERRAPATALREAVELMRRLWASPDEFDYDGEVITFRGARLSFAPVRPVPVAIAGRGPRILRLAGKVADEVLVATFTSGPLLDHSLARLEEGIAQRSASLDPIVRGSWVYLGVHEDGDVARDAVREGIAVALWGSRPIIEELGVKLPEDLAALMDSRSYAHTPDVIGQAAALVPDELVDVCSIAGTPADCVQRLRDLAGRGFEHIAIWPFPGEEQTTGDVVEALLTDVLPHVAAG